MKVSSRAIRRRLTAGDTAYPAGWPPRPHARFAVLALAAAYALASFDRAIITLVGEPLRRDFGITDVQFGILSGLAFAVPLAVLGIPAGRLADRWVRKVVLLGGVVVWSAMTGLCGVVKSFGPLVAARVGVGVGEAGISPTAMPIIADYFPPERRSRPISIYFLGTHLGQASAFILGGALLVRLDQLAPRAFPVIGTVRGWQLLFPIASIAGSLVVVLLLGMREPPRRELMRSAVQARGLALRDVARYVRRHVRAYGVILLAPTLLSVGFQALLVFLPTLLQRAHGWPVDQAGAMLGIVGLPMAVSGTLLAGVLGDYVTRRARRGGHALLLAWAILLAAPFCIAVPLAPNGYLAIAVLGGG
ncbi:MAG: MFS transporter, partial [Longimicrobiales bacterium]